MTLKPEEKTPEEKAGQVEEKKGQPSPDEKGQDDKADYKRLYEEEKEAREKAQQGFDEARSQRDTLLTEIKKTQKAPATESPKPSPEEMDDVEEIDLAIADVDKKIDEYEHAYEKPYDTTALKASKVGLVKQRKILIQSRENAAFMEGADKFMQAHPEIKDINPIIQVMREKALKKSRIDFEDALEIYQGKNAAALATAKTKEALETDRLADKARTQDGGKPLPAEKGETATSKWYKETFGEDLSAKMK